MSTTPRRGDVWMVDFGQPVGHEQGFRRPAVVLTSDRLTNRAGLAVVVPVTRTRTRRVMPLHVEIEPGTSGLTDTSYAKVEDIKSVSQLRLVRRLGTVGADTLGSVTHALRTLLEI